MSSSKSEGARSRQIGKGHGSPVRNKRASILDDDHAKQILPSRVSKKVCVLTMKKRMLAKTLYSTDKCTTDVEALLVAELMKLVLVVHRQCQKIQHDLNDKHRQDIRTSTMKVGVN